MSNFMNNQNYFDDDDPLNSTGVSKRSLVLFFLIDVSGSMKGTKIGELNTAMEELIPEIRRIGEKYLNPGLEYILSILCQYK